MEDHTTPKARRPWQSRVLIVEESRLAAESLMFTLDGDPLLIAIGYSLDPSEALELVTAYEPDAVVMGSNVDEAVQLDLCKRIHGLFPRVRVIGLHRRLVPREVEALYAAGAADCLAASCSADELLHAITNASSRQIVYERAEREAQRRSRPRDTGARIRRMCDKAELETVFQPLIKLTSEECVAYEALTRFPDASSWTTSDWFAAAREVGMAQMLELAAIAEALSHIDRIPPQAALAINISPAVAVTAEFFELAAPFAERLIIELTEHEPVEDYAALVEALGELRSLGARVAVDDVGAGFASLRHILRLSPEIVKLDLSLTRGIEDDPGVHALTSALVDFAAKTGALISAEGIETPAELSVLRELGIDHGQGYLLGMPGPLEVHLN
jgi:EAL domain-containing protein (putative c-di-GMP-specific phosphodiesterase class I)